jgi:hypothetical protein
MEKFEEDIAPPFLSRFSHSNTVTFKAKAKRSVPTTLSEAADIFPSLRMLRCDGIPCRPKSRLSIVNKLIVKEHVFTGPSFELKDDVRSGGAEVALIVWTFKAHGKPAIVEFSFRYRARNEKFPPDVALAARALFAALSNSKWAEAESSTKTAFIFNGGRD